jgi:hypothetical protein
VAGGVGADVLVAWIVQETLGVLNLDLRHARDSLEGQLNPPEATRSELLSRGLNVIVAMHIGGGFGHPPWLHAEVFFFAKIFFSKFLLKN